MTVRFLAPDVCGMFLFFCRIVMKKLICVRGFHGQPKICAIIYLIFIHCFDGHIRFKFFVNLVYDKNAFLEFNFTVLILYLKKCKFYKIDKKNIVSLHRIWLKLFDVRPRENKKLIYLKILRR